jgi:hypothetical protein
MSKYFDASGERLSMTEFLSLDRDEDDGTVDVYDKEGNALYPTVNEVRNGDTITLKIDDDYTMSEKEEEELDSALLNMVRSMGLLSTRGKLIAI